MKLEEIKPVNKDKKLTKKYINNSLRIIEKETREDKSCEDEFKSYKYLFKFLPIFLIIMLVTFLMPFFLISLQLLILFIKSNFS